MYEMDFFILLFKSFLVKLFTTYLYHVWALGSCIHFLNAVQLTS